MRVIAPPLDRKGEQKIRLRDDGETFFHWMGVFSPSFHLAPPPPIFLSDMLITPCAKLFAPSSVCDFFQSPRRPAAKKADRGDSLARKTERKGSGIYLICPRFFSVVNIDFDPVIHPYHKDESSQVPRVGFSGSLWTSSGKRDSRKQWDKG